MNDFWIELKKKCIFDKKHKQVNLNQNNSNIVNGLTCDKYVTIQFYGMTFRNTAIFIVLPKNPKQKTTTTPPPHSDN